MHAKMTVHFQPDCTKKRRKWGTAQQQTECREEDLQLSQYSHRESSAYLCPIHTKSITYYSTKQNHKKKKIHHNYQKGQKKPS